jgi:O-acetylhomoserine/O-acetylserine sulfhydrylase
MFPRLGINTKWVKDFSAEAIDAAIDDKTKAVYLESISNPGYNVSLPVRVLQRAPC